MSRTNVWSRRIKTLTLELERNLHLFLWGTCIGSQSHQKYVLDFHGFSTLSLLRYYVFDFMFDFHQISHHELPRVASSRNSSWSPLRLENKWLLQGQLQNQTLLTLKSIWTDIRGQTIDHKLSYYIPIGYSSMSYKFSKNIWIQGVITWDS